MQDFFRQFAHWVRAAPDELAIVSEGQSLTYAAFDRAVDHYAALLRGQSGGQNKVAAYLGDVGIPRTIAVVAALKSGVATYWLDSALAAGVARPIVDQFQTDFIIAEPGFAGEAAAQYGRPVLAAPPAHAPSEPVEPFPYTGIDPDAAGVIRLTSGSTGIPKGTPQTHRSLDARLVVKAKGYGPPRPPAQRHIYPTFNNLVETDDLWLLAHGHQNECFDFRKYGPLKLAEWVRARGITSLNVYVALFRQLFAVLDGVLDSVQEVNLIGEGTYRADYDLFARHTKPGTVFAVRFGATEYGEATHFRHTNGDPLPYDVIPLGHAYDEVSVRLETEDGRPAAPGEPGEMVVEGALVPPGYMNNPDMTAKAFLPPDEPGGAYRFRTSFVAYQDHQGFYHPVGRVDDQIKIRGYNVRPSEIEQVVLSHSAIDEAVVVDFAGENGIRRLACHYVSKDGAPLPATDLRAFVAAGLPAYMAPGVFIHHAAFERTRTGKVMRNALPHPSTVARTIDTADEPQTATEQALAAIWREVLIIPDFGREDDFFDVGGDSLQAMAMLVAIHQRFGINLPLESFILEGASLRQIAARIDGRRAADAAGEPALLKAGGGAPPLFVLHVAGGHLSDYLAMLNALDNTRPVLGIHPRGMDAATRPDASVEAMAAHAAAVIRRHGGPPYSLAGYSFGGVLAFETARALMAGGAAVSHLILLDPGVPWRDPLRLGKAVYRAFRDGNDGDGWRTVSRTVPAALGLRDAPQTLEEAHQTAMLRYKPAPFAPANALLVTAAQNPKAAEIEPAWRALLGGGLQIERFEADHMSLMKPPHIWPLAQAVARTLAA